MREVVGKNNIQFILTDGRTKVANDTRVLIQKVLDDYKAGVVITQVALQRTEPPASVIDAFRDVQAAQADRRSEEHTSELQSLMRISYAVFCLQKTNIIISYNQNKSSK